MSAPDQHAALAARLQRMLLVRHALEEAGLCGPDGSEEDDGREAAQAVLHALARQRIILHVIPPPEPPLPPPPTLGERLAAGATRLTRHIPAVAAKRPKWALRRVP